MKIRLPLKLILLNICGCLMAPVFADEIIYCPAVANLPELCESNNEYQNNSIPFPNCLIMQVDKRFVFNGGAYWKLNTVRPPYLSDPLQFVTANIDQTGTHCIYKTLYHDHYIRFSYANGSKLSPAKQSSNWQKTSTSRYHDSIANELESGNVYICNSNGDTKQCPMIKP